MGQKIFKKLRKEKKSKQEELNEQPSKRLDFLLNYAPLISREILLEHAFNAKDKSLNIIMNDDNEMTFRRIPVANSTDCIRGKIGYTTGLHLWEIQWSTLQRGSHAVIGVATDKAPLHSQRYQNLVGGNNQSWGWDIVRKRLNHNARQDYNFYPNDDRSFVVSNKIYVALDMDEGTLAFFVNGQYLGVAFHGLKGKKLFPIVSIVWGNGEVSLRYVGGLNFEPLPLIHLCRLSLSKQKRYLIRFNLPQPIIRYLSGKTESVGK